MNFLHKHIRFLLAIVLLLLMVPQARAGSYQLTDISYGLNTERVTAVAVHPRNGKEALAGVDGSVFKTDDGGQSWRVVLSFRYGLASDVSLLGDADSASTGHNTTSDDQVFAEPDYTVEDSEDGVPQTSDMNDAAGFSARDDGSLALPSGSAGEDRPVFACTLPGVRALRYAPGDSDVVYAATPMGLFRSTDRGESFVPVDLPRRSAVRDVRDVAINPLVPTHILIATRAGSFDSLDGGSSWQPLPGRVGRIASLSVAFLDNPLRSILVGSSEGLFRSDDDGKNYLLQLLAEGGRDQPVSSIAFDSNRQIIAVGTGRGLYTAGVNESIYRPFDLGQRSQVERVVFSPLPGGPLFVASSQGLFRVDLLRVDVVNLLADGDVRAAVDVSPDSRNRQILWLATRRGLFRRMKGSGAGGLALQHHRIEELLSREPTLDEVIEAARSYSGYAEDKLEPSRTRARFAAALPRVELTYRRMLVQDQGIGWGMGGIQGLEILDEIADFYGDIYDQDPLYFRSRDHSLALVSLRWDLDNAILHTDQTRISREQGRNSKAEHKLVLKVIKTYNSRLRALRKVLLRSSRDKKQEIKRLLRMLEYTAKLDALCGGYFSRQARARGAEAIIGVSYDGSPMPNSDPNSGPSSAQSSRARSRMIPKISQNKDKSQHAQTLTDAQASRTRG